MTAGAHVPGPQRSHQLVCNYSSETVKTMMAANGAPESSGKSERNKRQSDRKTERKKRGREKRPTSSAFFSRMVPTDRGCWEVVSKSVLLLQQILPILHRSYGMLDDDSRFFSGIFALCNGFDELQLLQRRCLDLDAVNSCIMDS